MPQCEYAEGGFVSTRNSGTRSYSREEGGGLPMKTRVAYCGEFSEMFAGSRRRVRLRGA